MMVDWTLVRTWSVIWLIAAGIQLVLIFFAKKLASWSLKKSYQFPWEINKPK